MKEILTPKIMGILLVLACLVYFLLNMWMLAMNFVTAITGAVCSALAFGVFVYFIREIRKQKNKPKGKK